MLILQLRSIQWLQFFDRAESSYTTATRLVLAEVLLLSGSLRRQRQMTKIDDVTSRVCDVEHGARRSNYHRARCAAS